MLRATASCATGAYDPEMWFSAEYASGRDDAGRARLVCVECPARAECLLLAMRAEAQTPELFRWGMYGGLGPSQRAWQARTGTAAQGARLPSPEPSRAWFAKPGALDLVRRWRDGEVDTAGAAAEVHVTRDTWLEGVARLAAQIVSTGEPLPAHEAGTVIPITRARGTTRAA